MEQSTIAQHGAGSLEEEKREEVVDEGEEEEVEEEVLDEGEEKEGWKG